jgi:hypothetical protein
MHDHSITLWVEADACLAAAAAAANEAKQTRAPSPECHKAVRVCNRHKQQQTQAGTSAAMYE